MNLFIACGIGDWFAITNKLSREEIEGTETIYWATRQEKLLRPLANIFFPNIKNHVTLCDEFTESEELNKNPNDVRLINRFCVHSMSDLLNRFPLKNPLPNEPIVDLNLSKVAHEFKKGIRRYTRPSIYLDGNLSALGKEFDHQFLSRIGMEGKHFVYIHPWSDNQRYEERDFTLADCEAVVRFCENRQTTGIVINKSKDKFPIESPYIIDATNETDLYTSLELVKQCEYFIGCSSSFSVFSAMVLPRDRIFIKASDGVRLSWDKFYYCPHTNTYFLNKNLEFLH